MRFRGCFADQECLAVTRWPDLGLVSVRLLANPPPAVHGTPRKPPKSFILASLPLFVARCTCSYIAGGCTLEKLRRLLIFSCVCWVYIRFMFVYVAQGTVPANNVSIYLSGLGARLFLLYCRVLGDEESRLRTPLC